MVNYGNKNNSEKQRYLYISFAGPSVLLFRRQTITHSVIKVKCIDYVVL